MFNLHTLILFKENITVVEDSTVYHKQMENSDSDTAQPNFEILKNLSLSNPNEHDTGDHEQVQESKIDITPKQVLAANDSNRNTGSTHSVLITEPLKETSK